MVTIPPFVASAGVKLNTPLFITAPLVVAVGSIAPTVDAPPEPPVLKLPSAIKYCVFSPSGIFIELTVTSPLIVVFPFFKTTIALLLVFSSAPLPITNKRSEAS